MATGATVLKTMQKREEEDFKNEEKLNSNDPRFQSKRNLNHVELRWSMYHSVWWTVSTKPVFTIHQMCTVQFYFTQYLIG